LGDTYNIGGGNNWKNLELVHVICHVLAELTGEPEEKFSRLIQFVTDRLGHDWRYAMNTSKIQAELGWHPIETFETGIRKTVAWYVAKYMQEWQGEKCQNCSC
jgi:dTDP-glucose 4,6-dehydratase